MRKSFILGLLSSMVVLAGCNDSTTEPTVVEKAQDWQMVIQSEAFFSTVPVAAIRTDRFMDLVLEDFRTARTLVFDIKSAEDTVYIGFGLWSSLWSEDFDSSSVSWTFSGRITPNDGNSSMDFGIASSLYRLSFLDESFDDARTPIIGSESHDATGDFQFSRDIMTDSLRVTDVFAVVYRPVTCSSFGASRLGSSGFTETQTDAVRTFRWRFDVGEIKITCNPAVSALRSDESAEEPVRFINHALAEMRKARH